MATLEKIRSKSVLLLVIIGAALVAFIIGDFFNSSRSIFGSGTTVAKVDGKSIDFTAFQRQVEAASQQAQNRGQKVDQAVLHQQVLNQMIAQALFDEEIEALGLTVTDSELSDAMLGSHSQAFQAMVQQMYQGQLTPQQFHDMVVNPAKYQLQPQEMEQIRQSWMACEKDMEQRLLQAKFGTLFAGTLVANKLDAKAIYDDAAQTSKVAYALAPFSSISDDDASVAVTDEDVKNEWAKHKAQYAINEDVRDVNYISVAIQPSSADITAGETRVTEAIAALNEKPGTDGLDAFDDFISNRYTVTVGSIRDAKVRNFVDSAAVGSAKIINRSGNNFQIAKLISRENKVDSVNVDILSAQGTKAQVDSILVALNSGKSIEDVQKSFASNIAGAQDSVWVSLIDPSVATVKDRLASVETGRFLLADTAFVENHPSMIVRVNKRRSPVPVVEVAAVDYTIEASAATLADLQGKFQKFLDENANAADFVANALEAGYQSFPAQISVSTPQLGGMSDTRNAISWALRADKGEVSPIFGDEASGRFVAVALNDIYEDYLPATNAQVKAMLTSKIRNDKKAEALIARYNGKAKDVAGYANAMGVKVDSASVNFANYNLSYPNYVGPKVLASVAAAKKGELVSPTQASNGVVVMQVLDVETNGRPYSFEENATTFSRTRGADALSQFLNAILLGNKEIKNNMLDFFRE